MDTITLAMAKAFTRRKIEEAGISGGGSGGEVNLTPEQVEEILEAVKLKHTHENQNILDQITEEVLREEVPHTYVLPETAKDGDLCLCAPTNTLTRADRKIYFDWEEFRKPYISNNEEYSEAFCYYIGGNETDGSGYNIGIGRGPEYCFLTLDSGGPDETRNCYINFQNGELIAEDSWEYFDNTENPEGVERQFTSIEELPQYIELPQVDYVEIDNQNYDNVFLFYTEYELMKYQGGEWVKVEKNQITEEWLDNFSENTRLRHTHSNLGLLETIVPEMLEAEIPIVHTLPTESKSGDICRYILKNKIMPEDSGKRIYFDWKNIKHFSLKEVTRHILYSASIGYGAASREVLSIIIENLNKSFHYFIKTRIDNEYIRILSVNFKSNGQFSSGSLDIQDLSGNQVSEVSYRDIDELPSSWELPEWRHLSDYYRSSECYFFHTGYKLMKYQGDEWVEAVEVPTKTSQLENDSGFINEESVPTVYTLPTEAQEGDLCFYISPNILTLLESGKRICFDWEAFRKPVNGETSFHFETETIELEGGLLKKKVSISGLKRGNRDSFIVYNSCSAEDAYTNFQVGFDSETGEFHDGCLESYNAGTIYYYSIEELPTFFDLPEFEEIVTNEFTTENENTQIPYFFHTAHNEYKLMKYQGGEWVEACASESGVSDEQIKNAVDEYLAENPVSGITVTDDGNGNVTIA